MSEENTEVKQEEQHAIATIAPRPVAMNSHGLAIADMGQAIKVAELISQSGQAIPQHLRGNVGMCFAVVLQAQELGMSPIGLANESYAVQGRLAYGAKVFTAALNARAGLKGRLKYRWVGEGEHMKCIAYGTFQGEDEPCECETPEICQITVKNSPLWKSKPKQQLAYVAARDFARLYCPDVMLGVLTDDEVMDSDPLRTERVDAGAAIKQRLANSEPKEGFVVPDAD